LRAELIDYYLSSTFHNEPFRPQNPATTTQCGGLGAPQAHTDGTAAPARQAGLLQQAQLDRGGLELVAPLLAGDYVLLDVAADFLGLVRDYGPHVAVFGA
jgi:hypothetical protein